MAKHICVVIETKPSRGSRHGGWMTYKVLSVHLPLKLDKSMLLSSLSMVHKCYSYIGIFSTSNPVKPSINKSS